MEPETSIAIGSAAISFSAFIVSIGQLHIQRSHNKLSVKPLIEPYFESDLGNPYLLTIKNCGLGPAIITEYEFSLGQDVLKSPTIKQIGECIKDFGIQTPGEVGSLTRGTNISIDQTVFLLKFDSTVAPAISQLFKHARFKITYESIYNESFTLTVDGRQLC